MNNSYKVTHDRPFITGAIQNYNSLGTLIILILSLYRLSTYWLHKNTKKYLRGFESGYIWRFLNQFI